VLGITGANAVLGVLVLHSDRERLAARFIPAKI
jgi:hypothetical protein